MPVLQAGSIADLVTSTLKELGRGKLTEIATNLQSYPAAREILKKNRVKVDSGYAIQAQIMVTHSDQAEVTGLYAPDTINAGDVLKSITVPWRHVKNHYVIDNHEVTMNRDPARIVDMVKTRRMDCLIGWSVLFERQFWSAPSSSSDESNLHGITFWLVKNNTDGFNGGAASGFTDVAGLDPATYSNWKNYTFKYTNITDDDFFTRLRRAVRRCNFMSPIDNPPVGSYKTSDPWGFYTCETIYEGAAAYIRSVNEDLGDDVNVKEGSAMIARRPLQWVPTLDSDSTNPIYGINWGWLKTHILGDWWMKETVFPNYPGYHNCTVTWMDCSLNWVYKNRREGFVGHTGV